jgi:hypothetical protein
MHEYTVELRVSGEDLDVDDISNDLNLVPSTLIQTIGNKNCSVWGYNGSDKRDYVIYWESLEEALLFVIKKLTPLKLKLEKYEFSHKVCLWCGHFQTSFDGGPRFSKELLRQLGDFGIEIYIDNYFTQTPEQD